MTLAIIIHKYDKKNYLDLEKKCNTGLGIFFTGEFSLTTIRLKFHIQIFLSKGFVWFFPYTTVVSKKARVLLSYKLRGGVGVNEEMFLGGIDSRDTHGSFISSQENGRQILGKMSLLHSTVWTRHHL